MALAISLAERSAFGGVVIARSGLGHRLLCCCVMFHEQPHHVLHASLGHLAKIRSEIRSVRVVAGDNLVRWTSRATSSYWASSSPHTARRTDFE